VIAFAAIAANVRDAAAGDPKADALVKQGSEAYAAGKYEDAISALQQALTIEPRKETLFALAQAERLGGHCTAAIAHYKQLLSLMTDFESAKLIQGNVALCENTQTTKPPPEPQAAPPPPPPPASTTKTVVRVERHGDALATSLFAVGALSVGAAAGLYIASNNARDDATTAGTLAIHNQLDDRADQERALSYVALGVGVSAMGYAVYRWVTGHDEQPPATVSIVPTRNAATVGLSASW
jgi:tetratricopeptide (TPR) repeat protein